MGILISDINKNFHVYNEHSFDYFSRISTVTSGKRCVFVSQEKYINQIDNSISMVITTPEIAEQIKKKGLECGICETEEPRGLFFDLLTKYENQKVSYADSIIADNSKISTKAIISSKGVNIGNNVEIGDYAQVLPGTTIGDNCVIQSGAIVGAQLFNTYKYKGKHNQIPQRGKIIIDDNVLIGANSVIAQAMYLYGTTRIGKGTKIDALVSVSHNDEIGTNCLICAGAVLGGYVKIGNDTEIALGACIKNAVTIGSNVMVGMGSVMLFDAKDGESWFGNPAKRMK